MIDREKESRICFFGGSGVLGNLSGSAGFAGGLTVIVQAQLVCGVGSGGGLAQEGLTLCSAQNRYWPFPEWALAQREEYPALKALTTVTQSKSRNWTSRARRRWQAM